MKRIITLFAIIITAAEALSAQRSTMLFSDQAGMPGVTSVYIGPEVLRSVGSSSVINSRIGGVAKLIDTVSSIEVISCDDKSTATLVALECNDILKQGDWTQLVNFSSGDNEGSAIFGRRSAPESAVSDTTSYNEVVVLVTDKGSVTAMHISGKLNIKDVLDNCLSAGKGSE